MKPCLKTITLTKQTQKRATSHSSHGAIQIFFNFSMKSKAQNSKKIVSLTSRKERKQLSTSPSSKESKPRQMLQLGSPSSSAFLKVLLLSLLHTHPSIFTDFTSRLRCAKHHSVSLSVQPLMSIKLIPGAQPLNALLCLHRIK